MLTEAEVASVACSREPAVQARAVRPRVPAADTLREGATTTRCPAGGATLPLFAGEESVQEQAGLFACLLWRPDSDRLNLSTLHANERLYRTDDFEFLEDVSRAMRGGIGARTLNASRMWGMVWPSATAVCWMYSKARLMCQAVYMSHLVGGGSSAGNSSGTSMPKSKSWIVGVGVMLLEGFRDVAGPDPGGDKEQEACAGMRSKRQPKWCGNGGDKVARKGGRLVAGFISAGNEIC